MNGLQRLSLGALVALALAAGLVWGLRSVPPTETEVIEAAAAAYVAETGGAPIDCAARPADAAGAWREVWLVVICDDGAWIAAYDRQGRPVEISRGFADGAPDT